MTVFRYFRPPGSTNFHMVTGQRSDGCRPCARGKYGTDAGCVSCPKGTYGVRTAMTSVLECTNCPPNTYGTKVGLTSSTCNYSCPTGYYSSTYGNTDITSCIVCPPFYQEGVCIKSLIPRSVQDPDKSKWQSVQGDENYKNPLPTNY